MKKKRSRVARRRLHIILICVIAAAAAFFGLFYTTDLEVTGNSLYTDDQIRSMIRSDPLSRNTVLMSLFHRKVRVDAALITEIRVTYVTRNKLRITVSEKYPIGYITLDGMNYYFDKDGVVIEATDSDGTSDAGESVTASSSAATASSSSVSTSVQETGSEDQSSEAQITAETPEPAVAATETPSAQDSSSEEEEQTGNGSSDYTPSLADVPRIEGLGVTEASVGQKLGVADDSVFTQILSLTKLIDKFDIQPDYVEFDSEMNMTLHYGDIRVNLGSDEYLEEKMTRTAAILPQLGGMSGELHLENYSKDTQNIIFDSDQAQQ